MSQNKDDGIHISQAKVRVGGDVAGRDKIDLTVNNIQQHASSAAEEARLARDIEAESLAQAVNAFAQNLKSLANKSSDGRNPYKGLYEYRLGDAEIFFGRAQAIREFAEQLDKPLTILQSESGACKTSLLQAGISPRLIAKGCLPLYLRPYSLNPSLAIKRAFLSDLNATPNLAKSSLRHFLQKVCGVLKSTTLYILLDQFEEFFNRLEEGERKKFVDELAECLDDESLNARWVLSLRTEYFGKVADFGSRIRNPFENSYQLKRLTPAEAREVIAEPAKARGITFEEGLIESLLDDLGKTEIAPPQVQLVCSELYQEIGEGETTITRASYEREGKAAGILRGHLERVLSRELPAPQRAAARGLLESLITSESQRIIRTHTELIAELSQRGVTPETLDVILNQLVNSRLLRVEESDDGLAYELAHDYLLSEIKLDPDVQARKAAQELLEQETRAYSRFKTLLTEDRLKVIEPYQSELRFTPEAQKLFEASRAKVQRERWASESRRNVFVIGAAAIAVVMTLLGLFGLNRSQEAQAQAATAIAAKVEAQKQAKIAFSRQLAAQSQTHLSDELDLALLLGIEANRMPNIFEARNVLFKGLNQNPFIPTFLRGHKSYVSSVAFSADGKTLASGSGDTTIILWDVTNQKSPTQLSLLAGHKSWVDSVAFSVDGKTLASGSGDTTIILWDVTNPKSPTQLSVLAGHRGSVYSVAFSADGKTLASGSSDGAIILWDVTNPKSPKQLSVLAGYSVAFSSDGKTLASGSGDKTIILWDVTDLKSPKQLSVLSGTSLGRFTFSADGKTLASGSLDNTIILWDVTNPKSPTQLSVLVGHKDSVISVAFSAGGKMLASGSSDTTIILWDVTNPKSPTQLSGLVGHTHYVNSVAFSADGKTLASGSWDTTIILWDVTRSESLMLLSVLSGHDVVTGIAFSGDGKTLASGSWGGPITLWDVTNPRLPMQLSMLSGHKDDSSSVVFSQDGKTLASGGWDGTVILWDVTNPRSPVKLSVLSFFIDDVIESIAFSADGKMLAL